MIALCCVGGRKMTAVLERALKPGGVLVIEAFYRDGTKGQSIGRNCV